MCLDHSTELDSEEPDGWPLFVAVFHVSSLAFCELSCIVDRENCFVGASSMLCDRCDGRTHEQIHLQKAFLKESLKSRRYRPGHLDK